MPSCISIAHVVGTRSSSDGPTAAQRMRSPVARRLLDRSVPRRRRLRVRGIGRLPPPPFRRLARAHTALPRRHRQAKKNVALNGAAVQRAARVAHLDWSDAPPRLPTGELGATAAPSLDDDAANMDAEVAVELGGQFELLIAADIINNQGLSELVYRRARAALHVADRRNGVHVVRAADATG